MLTAIRIENFRGIRQGDVEGFDRINLLVGPNGSGKSTLLEAIFAGGDSPASVHRGQHLLAERHNESGFPSNECVYGKADPQAIRVEYSQGGELDTLNWRSDGLRWSDVKVNPSIDSPEALQDSRHREAYWAVIKSSVAFLHGMRFLDIRLLLDNELERQTWDGLLNVRADRVLVRALNEIYGLSIESFSYSAKSQALKALYADRSFALNIDDLGAGIRIAFRTLTQLILARGSALLVEEIDGYQHVDSYGKFALTLCDLSKSHDVQLFIATHSLEAVSTFIQLAKERSDIGLKLFQTRLSNDGTFEAAGFDANAADLLFAGGFDLRRTA